MLTLTSRSSAALFATFPRLIAARRFQSDASLLSLEEQVKALKETVQKQQVAIVALTKKLPQVAQKSQEASTNTSSAELQNSAIAELQRRLNSVEQRVAAVEQKSRLLQSNNPSPSSVSSTSEASSIAPAAYDLKLSELRNRVAQLESRQSVVKLSQRRQSLPGGFSHNESSSRGHGGKTIEHVVAFEPGPDGTPRLATTQVLVFHPTASGAEVRELMEGVGTVVSCLRRPGGPAQHNGRNRHKRDGSGSGSGKRHNSSPSAENSTDTRSAFVVTFQSTVDAVRAVETLAGMLIRGIRVALEPYTLPEQGLALSCSGSLDDNDDVDVAASMDDLDVDDGALKL